MDNYFKLCKDRLLYEICEILGLEFKTINNDNDYIWALITSTLLHNEKLCGGEKIDEYLDSLDISKSIEEHILRYPLDTSYRLDTERFNNYFLDENNNYGTNTTFDKYTYLNEEYITNDKEYYLGGLDLNYGVNTSIITDEILDYKKFIKRVRNSLAHSNYEIINGDQIRLYHHNNNGNLDFNVILAKPLVITIIDEINEKSYYIYKDLINELDDYNSNNKEKREINSKDINSYLDNYKFLSEDERCKIVVFIDKYIEEYEINDKYLIYNKIDELAFRKIKNTYNSALVLDSIITNSYKNDLLYDDYFYYRYGAYNYSSIDIRQSKEYKKEKVNLLLISLLNTIFLKEFNTIENDKSLDMSLVEIDPKFLLFKNNKLVNEQKTKLKELDKITGIIVKNKKLLSEEYRNNDYFNITLPSIITSLENDLVLKNSIFPKKINIDILAHVRNSLAHGNTTYDYDRQTIRFKDFDPFTHKITFKGKISIANFFILLEKNGIIEPEKVLKLR